MYAQKEQEEAHLSQDRSSSAGSGSGQVRRPQQPEFSALTAELQVRDGTIHRLVLFRAALALNRAVVLRFRLYLESLGLAAGTINQRLAAVRRLAYEAADSGPLSPELAAGIRRVKGVKQLGSRAGNWLTHDQARTLLEKADGNDLRSLRDLAIISVLLGCGLRRAELSALKVDDLQIRQGHWAIVDLVGKGGHIRTVPMPLWVKAAIDRWISAASVKTGRVAGASPRPDRVSGQPLWISDSSAGGGKRLNPEAFSIPSSGQQGTEPRNDIPGFGLTQVDVSLVRKIAIRDRVNVQFRTDALNVLNHPNFQNPHAYVGVGNTYLQSTSMLNKGLGGLNPLFQQGGPRSLQLSLRVSF